MRKTYRKLVNWFAQRPRWSTFGGALAGVSYVLSMPQLDPVPGVNLAWAAAIPAATTLIGGYMSQKGTDKAIEASQMGSKMTEQARQEAKTYVQPMNIYNMAQWMFPGLLPNPKTNSSNQVGGQPYFQDASNATGDPKNITKTMDAKQALVNAQNSPSGGIYTGMHDKLVSQAKADLDALAAQSVQADKVPQMAQGGNLQAGQTALVGEQGPELFQPSQAGTVVPNPNTPTNGGSGGTTIGGAGTGDTQIPPPTPTTPGNQTDPVASQEDTYGSGNVNPNAANAGNQVWAGGAAPKAPTLGELSVQHATNFLENPGQLDTTSYEAAQEQANQGLQTNTQALMGALTGMGIDPRSGLGQTMLQSATNESNRMRNEASRNLTQQTETLKRADIQTGMTAYQNFLNQVFGIVGTQAGVAGAGAFPNAAPINPYEGVATAITAGGSMFGDYMANKPAKTPEPNYSQG